MPRGCICCTAACAAAPTSQAGCLCAVPARLVKAAKSAAGWEGRLELLYKGSWLPACSSAISAETASVVCRQVRVFP